MRFAGDSDKRKNRVKFFFQAKSKKEILPKDETTFYDEKSTVGPREQIEFFKRNRGTEKILE